MLSSYGAEGILTMSDTILDRIVHKSIRIDTGA